MPQPSSGQPSARILLVDADIAAALVTEQVLCDAGFVVVHERDGQSACDRLRTESFDLLITELRLPNLDGIGLLQRLAAPALPVLVLTSERDGTDRLNRAGVHVEQFLTKPCPADELLARVRANRTPLRRVATPAHTSTPPRPSAPLVPACEPQPAAEFPVLALAASTGGPDAMERVLRDVPLDDAACVAVLHGPGWVLESFATRLAHDARRIVAVGTDGAPLRRGTLYLAPGDRHMRIAPGGKTLALDDGPPEHYVRPAADPLFRSVAAHFGQHAVIAVLTGLGQDGLAGARAVAAKGGTVLVQDPLTCVAPYMPRAIVEGGVPCTSHRLEHLGSAIATQLARLTAGLTKPAAR